jgi:DNA-binding transcriptional MerR regulator
MHYTINQLAKLSGVTVRTLRFYDEISLLKPAYIADNGYRYYQKKELLLLQQILFFRELGFELKDIKKIILQSDFDRLETLFLHKKVLKRNILRTNQLIKTIDKTIQHLEDKQAMNEKELFKGFDIKKQTEYEQYLVKRFGDTTKDHITQSYKNMKKMSTSDWDHLKKEFTDICTELSILQKEHYKTDDAHVQAIIKRHYEWLKHFWIPNRESYTGMGQGYTTKEWEATFAPYPQLAHYLAEAIGIFAEKNLKSEC